MIVRILTNRPDQYVFLERLYRGSAEILYTTGSELMTAGNKMEADILIADPELAEGKQFTGTLMKRRTARGKPFVISEPDRVRGLVRELKAVGLKTDENLPAGDTGSEKAESVFPGEGSVESQRPSFRCAIGIMEFNEGAGAGFLTLLLAEELASESFREGSLVTVFAPDSLYFFHALSLGKKFGKNGFQNVSDLLDEGSFSELKERVSVNVSEGISWAVGSVSSYEERKWSLEERTEMAGRIEGNYLLCFYGKPFSDREREEVKNMLDVLVVVGNPLPSSLLAGKKTLETLRQLELPVIYVVNHVTDVVKKDLIIDYLDTNEVVFVPAVDPAAVCEAEYMGENPYRLDIIRKQTMASICGIIEQIKKLGNIS